MSDLIFGRRDDTGRTRRDGVDVPTIVVDGVPRLLASVPGLPGAFSLPGWSTANPVLPRTAWQPIDLDDPSLGVYDQGAASSCTGQASVGSLMRLRGLMGQPTVTLSPTYPYAHCNGGRDAGAMIGDVVTFLRDRGTCELRHCPQSVVYKNQIPPAAHAGAVYKVADAYQAESFDDIASGLVLGWMPVFALQVGNLWSVHGGSLNAAGLPPVYTGPGNHALLGAGLHHSPTYGWLVRTVNSWGPAWGQGGYCNTAEAHFEATRYCDAYLIRLPDLAPGDLVGPTVPGTAKGEVTG